MSKDYRVFVGAFVKGELAERIQAVREKYDPVTARITAPHVTLAGTYWRSGPATAESEAKSIRRLQILEGLIQPFTLYLGGVRTFPGKRPVVYIHVEVTDELMEARRLLLSVLGADKHRDFNPHLTLAMRLSWEKSWEMVTELQASELNRETGQAPIRILQLMQRGPQDQAWRSIFSLPLNTPI